ncbi:MAG TPA: Rieske 2Fe-2S domain-containing protein [Xanthobacteraceae bacterium]|jgi:phenylpropionate dioxygenase-like ring-hydroxylating dioxygenase large terminal subunit|nr:Rieske 2Fe-2S domain-containing protein [Xanthobacteraceae bacterium]
MLTKDQNQLLTRTGRGTPGGALMRCYWQPVALAEEIPFGAPPMPVKILSEELVLFRDERDRLGLLGLYCSHRRADLSYGRIEDGGLRCLYHGWLYDISGRCLDQPAEAVGSCYKDEIRHLAYPVLERGGLVFAYMGNGEPPLLPSYEFLGAEPDHRYLVKTYLECNYLQGLEGDIDPAHLSFLHRSLRRRPLGRKDARTVPGSSVAAATLTRGDRRPQLEAERTDFGLRNYAIRDAADGQRYVRINNFIMPNKVAAIGNEGRVSEGYTIHWRVPIDDENHVRFDFYFNRVRPVARERYEQELAAEVVDHRFRRNKRNRYLQDREQMRTGNFTGMGDFYSAQDAFAAESPGPIHDRTREHLGASDVCIVAARRQLLTAIADVKAGREPIHVIRDPTQDDMSHIVVVSEVIPPDTDHKALWKKRMHPSATGSRTPLPGNPSQKQPARPPSVRGARSKRPRRVKSPGSSRSIP